MQDRKDNVGPIIVVTVAVLVFVCGYMMFIVLFPVRQQNKSQFNPAQQELLQEVNQLRQKVNKELALRYPKIIERLDHLWIGSLSEKEKEECDLDDLLWRSRDKLNMAEGYVLNENFADAERYLKSAKEKWNEYENLRTDKQP